MPRPTNGALRTLLPGGDAVARNVCAGANGSVSYAAILTGSCFADPSFDFRGRSVLLATPDQLSTSIAMIQLDGVARRVVLCPPDVEPRHFGAIVADAAIDVVVCGNTNADIDALGLPVIPARPTSDERSSFPNGQRQTEWILLTSGTSGVPKLVLHDVASLVGAIKPASLQPDAAVWATFYDIRRYGGLQIFLRALMGGHSMILSHADEPIGAHLERLQRGGVTHISGTPSHWRRLLMSGQAHRISPRYVRLSGEIADQAILDALKAAYPNAGISHAYASTEAGVGFNVTDGIEGFPASMIDDSAAGSDVVMKIVDGSLHIRSSRTATRYLGDGQAAIIGDDGFVDTGDQVALRGDRYHFIGRRNGMINVGGAKIYPEEIEAVLNSHPAVRMSLVQGRRNPITGALVVADVVLKHPCRDNRSTEVIEAILDTCRSALPPHKVPTRLRIVPHLDVAPSGKLVRNHA